MASKVRAHVVKEDTAAACKLGAFHWKMLCNPVSEVVNPTTPAMREKIMIRVETSNFFSSFFSFFPSSQSSPITFFLCPLNPMIPCP